MPINPGFSAVELLLVAGIIAILVAIAVPGYLDARVRAEITDVKKNLIEVHNALILYKVNCNQFPEKPIYPYYFNPLNRLIKGQMLDSEPVDRFKKGLIGYGSYYSDSYFGYDYIDPTITYYTKIYARLTANAKDISMGINGDGYWYVKSIGPDQTDFRDEGLGRGSNQQNILGMVSYDPTNGVFSLGEIINDRDSQLSK